MLKNSVFVTGNFEEVGSESGVSKPFWNKMNDLLKHMLATDPNNRIKAVDI